MRRLSAVALTALAFAVIGGLGAGTEDKHPARGGVDYDAPTARWREGPARYLLTKEEDDLFRTLTTDPDRAVFIQRFWARRDPIGSTPENEYRLLFYARVVEANRLFTDSTKPGWKTDRGKIYILLGPPDDMTQESPRDALLNVITWSYRAPLGAEHVDVPPVIRFTSDVTGEYYLTDNITLPGLMTPSGIASQILALQMKSLPDPQKLLDSIVSAQAPSNTGPFMTHHDFYREADGGTFAVLTLGVKPDRPSPAAAASSDTPGAAPERFDVLARLVGSTPDLPSYDLAGPRRLRGDDGGPVPDADGFLLFQGGLPVRPGTYSAVYAVVERGVDHVQSYKETVEIPNLKEPRFGLTRITLASRLEPVERRRGQPMTPFVVGNLRALPRSDDLYHDGDDLSFYYQIYDPENDPIDGRPDLDVEYRFFVAEDDGAGGLKFVPLGMPVRLTRQRSQVQGYTFPLRDWRPAIYRLRVQVTDNLSGRHATEEVSFRIL